MSASINNLYRATPRQVRGFLLECFYAQLVPFLKSSPGCGKSTIMGSVADELNLAMIDHRASTSDPTDFTGLPGFQDGRAKFMPFEEIFPLEGQPLPKGKDGWLIFLDEWNSAPKPVIAAGYKLILDRMVGQHHLHENVVIACAGNLDTDRAITTPINTAMQSRMVHLEMMVSFEEWMEDVALKESYDPRIIAYLSQYDSKLMDFRPDHGESTFCCPRTWSFMNRLIQGREVTEDRAALYAGTITSGVAVDFIQFTKVFHNLVTVKDILRSPETCPVSSDTSTRWATISHMMEKVTEDNFGGLSTYADRFPLDFRILFYRSTMVRQRDLRQHPAFRKAMVELNRYLHE